MALACKYCGSPRLHRSRRYSVDYLASTLFGYFPYRCSACNRRFRLKRAESRAPAEPPADQPGASAAPPRTTGRARRSPSSPRRTKRAFLRELVLYLIALGGFLAFLRWVSEDHQSPPPE